MRSELFLASVVIAAVLVQATPARAQVPGVTLEASSTRIVFGRTVALFGGIEPPSQGETVDIVTEAGAVVATAITNQDGEYRTRFAPRRNVGVRAQWIGSFSDEVRLKVKPLVDAHLGRTRLFAQTRVRGRVRPAGAAESAAIRLLRNGRTVARRSISVRKGRFATRFRVRNTGRYRAKVRVDPSEHLPAGDRTAARIPPTPDLDPGSRGKYVRLLENRLLDLGYHLPKADRIYDNKTYDAVIAFNKVQRHPRTGDISESTWRVLADPIRARPRTSGRGFRIEIDQTRQVIFVVRGKRVRWVLHTSTGAGGATRDGRYRVFRKINGTSGGGLYYPSYFDGLRAIHGWSSVPTYPASHGCSRVPMWAARWIYGLAKIGTRVIVYH